MNLDPGLGALRPLGGFFALHTPADGSAGPADGLPTLAAAYGAPHEGGPPQPHGDPLTFRVRKVVRALRAPEDRVGASVAQQGLAARLWSVALGCAVLYGGVPDLAPELLRWDPDGAAPDDLWLTRVRPLPADAATVARVVVDGHLEPLGAALRARGPVAAGLLRGNAGSALAATARLLEQWARANGRPEVDARARALTAELLTHPYLEGAGVLTGAHYRRRSCCLYYRAPGGGLCGDCCFTRPPRSSPRAPSG
ncbi:(2Fe-2S)-binding protein [Streptomyces hilarionis]|uniref:(2Fe-2S)-binding protein n=1 Tax=Streptomyces hilarionis TaxID=2839954 RepID=UPI00211A875C|nr:(2Fe-2S)-binding protein [Streptomyces hilarionis]MCQ9135744.1 (2Fe-2S)-binding protein [Streptomyces hilarionis]